MAFPHYKEWMGERDRIGDVYAEGVRQFIKYARRSLQSDVIPCPCNHCDNGRCLHFEKNELHLIKWGIVEYYKFWSLHGERDLPYVSEQPPEMNTVQVEDDPLAHPRLNDLIDDCFGVHDLQDNQPTDCKDGEDHESCPKTYVNDEVNLDKEYMRLKAEAARPLYSNCNEGHTSLYAMIGLQNIKSRFGLSSNSVTEILLWVKDLLPKDNTLPNNYPSMKNNLKGLGMQYKSIHACKYDCILYRKEHEKKDKCPVCQEPKYVLQKDQNIQRLKFLKVPQKVLKYFPLAPRLKRLYTIRWIAEAMTWHSRAKVGGNLMRHPIDSAIWKATNMAHPEFAKEVRNIRLGLVTDGFNPFSNLSTNQSVWPVILVPYSLPLSLCMRKEFSMLSLLIPGPKAPSNDIDVFLAPLIEELKVLWVEGVKAFDSHKQEEFTLRATLLWAIHDFPAYGTLSGCNVHGYFGCPICGKETGSEWLPSSQKICYHTHRRFLPIDHKFRCDPNNFLPNGIEIRVAPKRLSGSEIEMKANRVEHNLSGKHRKIVGLRRKSKGDPNDPNNMKPWSRRSMLFDLPNWKEHSIRHVLDIMHAEKNIIEHLVSTCLGGTNTKDREKAREDLRLMRIKKSLWLKEDLESGRTIIPDGAFTLTSSERKVFLDTLHDLKVPTSFCSNLCRVVNYARNDLKQCKSHNWHVIMQLTPLLFKHCFSKYKELRKAIMQISLCFSLLYEKVVNKNHILVAKRTLVEATCVLEKYFPPSFFDISIHLLVHVCDEALICGPVRYRWMYPFERLMKRFKDYVKNNRYIGGSIAEEYTLEEASLFAREYMPNPGIGGLNLCRERFVDEFDDYADEGPLGKGKQVRLTNVQYEQVTRYVFDTQKNVDEWREKYIAMGRNKRRKGASSTHGDFRLWVLNEEFGRYRINGYVFSSYSREEHLVGKQNSGISIKALTSCIASSRDKNPVETELTFYGVVQQILELNYSSFKVIVFYYDWVRVGDRNACRLDQATNIVMVDLTKMKRKDNINDEPFVCAFQNIKQVFYLKYINNGQWSVVLNSPKHLTTRADALEAPREYQSVLDENPNLLAFLDHLDG